MGIRLFMYAYYRVLMSRSENDSINDLQQSACAWLETSD
jgi:hypothetical protein